MLATCRHVVRCGYSRIPRSRSRFRTVRFRQTLGRAWTCSRTRPGALDERPRPRLLEPYLWVASRTAPKGTRAGAGLPATSRLLSPLANLASAFRARARSAPGPAMCLAPHAFGRPSKAVGLDDPSDGVHRLFAALPQTPEGRPLRHERLVRRPRPVGAFAQGSAVDPVDLGQWPAVPDGRCEDAAVLPARRRTPRRPPAAGGGPPPDIPPARPGSTAGLCPVDSVRSSRGRRSAPSRPWSGPWRPAWRAGASGAIKVAPLPPLCVGVASEASVLPDGRRSRRRGVRPFDVALQPASYRASGSSLHVARLPPARMSSGAPACGLRARVHRRPVLSAVVVPHRQRASMHRAPDRPATKMRPGQRLLQIKQLALATTTRGDDAAV